MPKRATRTVRLDEATDAALAEARRLTGMSVSQILEQGILLVRDSASEREAARPYDVYARIDIGPGGYASASSRRTKSAFRERLARKYGR
jgi:hypothetical protein